LVVVALLAALLAGSGLWSGTAGAVTTPPPLAHASIPPGPPSSSNVHSQAVSGGAPGYWEVSSAGVVAGYGVGTYGDLSGVALNRPIVGMAANPEGGGYWLVASDGGIFTFGNAGFYGSTGAIHLNQPIVGMAATPDGKGYWLVASDGGIFAFGDARFFGSTGNIHLNKPVVGMAPTPGGNGYWLVASDGGIFAFGQNTFYGSTGNIALAKPIVGMTPTPDGHGYWMVASDGGIFAFGDAPFLGSSGGGADAVVGMAGTGFGSPYTTGTVGFDISFPQCTSGGGANLPPAGSSVSIVGVNDGLSPEEAPTDDQPDYNPCFVTQAKWAGAHLSVYINLDDNLISIPSAAQASAIGAADAEADVNFVHAEGFHPQVWWLDIEAPCGFSEVLWLCGTTGELLNREVIEGAVNELHAFGLTAGLYSTYLQWPDIVGSGVTISEIPIWIAGAADSEELINFCTDPAHHFAGGTPYLVQWAGGSDGSPWDEDYACAP
jgi:hypothetical protein